MSKNKENKGSKIIRSTDSGRLYIKTSDFFGQERVIHLIDKLMNSSVYKKIKEQQYAEAVIASKE